MSGDGVVKALVTGGGGFLGKAVVSQLLDRGYEVSSFSRGPHPELERMGAMTVQGDISKGPDVLGALKGMDVVFHTAAKVGFWGKYAEFHRINVDGTQNVLKACRKNNIRYLVHTSSPSVVFDGKDMEGVDESAPYARNPGSHYNRTKTIAEKSVLRSNNEELRTISLRPHLIWGPGDQQLVPRIMDAAREGKLRIIGDGRKKVDTVYIDNAARAHLLAYDALLENDNASGRPFFISNGEPKNTTELINRFLKLVDIPPIEKKVPRWIALLGAGGLEAVHSLLRLKGEPMITRFLVEELSTSHWFDISAARKELGYVPEVSIEEGLRRYKRTFMKNAG